MVAPEPRLPTPKQALLAWIFGLVLIALVGVLVAATAAFVAVHQGLTWERAVSLILDPSSSPLVTSPSWIALGIAANELAVAALLFRWYRRLRAPLAAIVPLARPSSQALLGAVLLPFGLSPLADVFGELARRVSPLDITSDHLVSAVSRHTSPALFAGILFAAAVLPACVEEMMFRGFVTSAFQRYSPLVRLIVPSVLFGVFHVEPTQVAGTIVLGFAFGLVRLYTGSLWACIVSHLVYNVGVILLARYSDLLEGSSPSWARVGLGVLLAALGQWLLVRDLGQRYLARNPG